ncbi:Ca2+-transporting ATPase [Clostridium tetanomorphum]|uniref:Cation-transporting P-type ATPase n=1 Tax=Clostridium tetanomorphum TaxID=1553 RepID=A0A923EBI1_CLOTT|nr:cation-transporting P-type ATPase [Clostridium tetanomorphum]KAJ53841.1 cation transporting ATPase [Clostridium tetanomorphum DSM 665]MBC2397355.1 cation-transporting P-type ATPase [Clostridium tetanomorphum]MBP1862575.1 Ca2+-transporting ATPase [Clostridium tetanomorphum]NRS85584.1 Ca2+-transporting ATPase [Clostridium tetanomorphum]NRZ96405.1 Ca2+-transporting ATPase [Clostridium tetanomorphum]
MTEWYSNSWNDIVKKLNSNIYSGLSDNKVEEIQSLYGKNIIEIPKSKNFISIFIRQFGRMWIVLLLITLGIFFYVGDVKAFTVLLFILFLNLFFLTNSQYKEEKNLMELQKLESKYTIVIRNRKEVKILSEDLVVGDIVVLNKGDIVPADLRIIESNSLKVKEGAVTGEGYTVEKYSTKIEDNEISLSEMKNLLFKSSVIMDGNATAIAIATGMNTQIANILSMLFEEKTEKHLLESKLQKLMNSLSVIAIIATSVFTIFNIVSKEKLNYILYNLGCLLIAFIPENIFLILVIIGYILLKYFRKKGVYFKNLSVIQNLSQISLICDDKVGVISENTMDIDKLYANENIIESSQVTLDEENENNHIIERMVQIGLLCNDTKVINGDFINNKNDLVEIGISKFAFDVGMSKERIEVGQERIFQIPFDRERRIMTTINKVEDNYRANVKGAVDVLLNKCTHIVKSGIEKEITEEDIKKIKNADIIMSKEGLSSIAFAYRSFNYEPSLKENIESNLVFVGLMAFKNPLKANADNLIKNCRAMHIKPIIITEDNKIAAEAFGRNISMVGKNKKILSGVEIDNMPEEDFEKIVENIGVFSRIGAKQKVKIAKFYKEHKHKILMSGARITDLPYLRIANVGISTGNSNIVKKLSDIILIERSFSNTLNIIELSRKFINSIKKVIIYILVSSFCEFIYVALTNLFGYKYSLMSLNMLWINSFTVMLASIAIMLDYKNENIDYRPDIIDDYILKDNIGSIVLKSAFVALTAFIALKLNTDLNLEIKSTISLFILNISLIIYSLVYSEGYFFKNKVSNVITVVNILFQIIPIIIINKINVFSLFNINLWKMPIIMVFVYIAIIIFGKIIHKQEQYE